MSRSRKSRIPLCSICAQIVHLDAADKRPFISCGDPCNRTCVHRSCADDQLERKKLSSYSVQCTHRDCRKIITHAYEFDATNTLSIAIALILLCVFSATLPGYTLKAFYYRAYYPHYCNADTQKCEFFIERDSIYNAFEYIAFVDIPREDRWFFDPTKYSDSRRLFISDGFSLDGAHVFISIYTTLLVSALTAIPLSVIWVCSKLCACCCRPCLRPLSRRFYRYRP
jgi:hypothetical protein